MSEENSIDEGQEQVSEPVKPELCLDIPKRGKGRPKHGEEVTNTRLEKYVLNRYLIERASIKALSLECNVDSHTIRKILDKHNVRLALRVTKARIAGILPTAAENVAGVIAAGDSEMSFRLLDKTGALNVDPTKHPSDQPGAITINLGFLGTDRAKAILAPQPASSPDSEPIDVDAEPHEDEG